MNLSQRFLRTCRAALFHPKLVDSTGRALTGGELLTSTLVVRRVLERMYLSAQDQNVGVLLPPSIGAVLANTALTVARRIPVNLNYTLPGKTINSCMTRARIRHVVTSRVFLTKLNLDIDATFVYLEDVFKGATWYDYVVAAMQAYVWPVSILEAHLGLTKVSGADLMTILFTSGTTGEPKGVMLSHENISSNIDAANQLFQLRNTDAVLGVLPFFHSYGFTGGLWLVLAQPARGVYHYSPLDASTIGRLCQHYRVTIMLAAPTFLRLYLKSCEPEQLRTIDTVVLGAEKMPPDLAQSFQDKFGVRPFEAYGTTELSPMAAINVPPHRSPQGSTSNAKEGTVGRAIPGTWARIVDLDTHVEQTTPDTPGMLQIQGPNVMLGYLEQPQKTSEVIRDGWYDTGDIARIDREGFITIVDRASRFSKIGGEMVPHLKIEECLRQIMSTETGSQPAPQVVVTSVPDPRKGEKLIVLHQALNLSVDSVVSQMAEMGLPNLWIPARDSFVHVSEFPILASGKLDLKRVKEIAQAHVAEREMQGQR